tara:strand:- start:267 stop:668 length:402 start_codon:yes stop_codon:yes gene_type:complete
MAKEAPTVSVAIDDSGGSARTISNDITGLSWSIPRAVQDVTGVDKSAIERLLLLADLSATYDGIFNDASNMSHDVFKTVGSASVARTVTLVMSGQTLASEQLLTDYPLTRASSGELTFSVPGVLQSGTAPTWA